MSAPQFATLDSRLARMESTFTLVPAMMGERAASFMTIHYLIENSDIVQEQVNRNAGSEPLQSIRLWAPLRPITIADQAYILRILSEVMEVIDKPGRDGSDAIHEIEARVQNAPQLN